MECKDSEGQGGVCENGWTWDNWHVLEGWNARVLEGGWEYVRMDGLGITGMSLRSGMQDANNGIEVKLELTLLALWCVNVAVVVIVVIVVIVVVIITVIIVIVMSWLDEVNSRITNAPAEGTVSFSACQSLELLLSYLQVLDVSGCTVLQSACPSNLILLIVVTATTLVPVFLIPVVVIININ